MKKILISTISFWFVVFAYCQNNQNKTYKIVTVAFYNLENFLDTIDDPDTKDEYSPILQLKSNKSKAYWNKINNSAKVISKIGRNKSGQSPIVVGLCEIENDAVIQDLLKSDFLKNEGYSFINIPSSDWRGIDVALLYKEKYFEISNFKSFKLNAYNRKGYKVKTRDQLLVSGYLENEQIHFIVNHWPSQRGGEKKTEYLREKSAELTNSIIKEIEEEFSDPKIIVMGDFNENPNSKSLKKVLKTKTNKNKLNSKHLYNPYEILFKNGIGTLGYRDKMNLFDQIIVSGNLVTNNNNFNTYKLFKSKVYNPNFLITKKGKYKGYPYRSWSNGKFTGGYSDHFPVYIYLIKENKK